MKLREVVTENFCRILNAGHLSQRKLAESLGVSPATIQRWRSGENVPEIKNLEAIAEVYQINPIEFFKNDNAAEITDIDKAITVLATKLGYEPPKKKSKDS